MLDPESRYYRFGWWFGVVMLIFCLLLIPGALYYGGWLTAVASLLMAVALTFFYLRPIDPSDDPSDPKSPRNVRAYYFNSLILIASLLLILQTILQTVALNR